MSTSVPNSDLLFQLQNAAIDLARQLGAAEAKLERLQADSGRPLYVVPGQVKFDDPQPPGSILKVELPNRLGIGKAVPCDDNLNPLSVESAEDLQKSELRRMQQAAISVIAGCNTLKSFKHRKLPSDTPYRTPALADVEKAVCREIRLIEQLNIATDALVYLGGLGDGTSHTNDVAKRALDRIRCTPMPTHRCRVESFVKS